MPSSKTRVALGLNKATASRTTASGRKQNPPSGHRPSGAATIGPMISVTTETSSRTATVMGFAGIGRYA